MQAAAARWEAVYFIHQPGDRPRGFESLLLDQDKAVIPWIFGSQSRPRYPCSRMTV